MGDKVDYQHGGESDGKAFTAPLTKSGTFGAFSSEEASQKGAVPGAKQEMPPSFDLGQ